MSADVIEKKYESYLLEAKYGRIEKYKQRITTLEECLTIKACTECD